MLLDWQAAADNVRNREGKRVFYLGEGDCLTSEARDYLNRERIEILPAQRAVPEAYMLPGGGEIREKPEHMTHLRGNILVPKTHPRIAFRGEVDTLEGELLLAVHQAQGQVRADLEELLALTRRLIRWEVMEEPAPEQRVLGLTEQELRSHSHRPQDFYGQPHFMPTGEESGLLLQINRARCAARRTELSGVQAFTDRDGAPERPDLLRVLNRLSSALYLLMIRLKREEKHES